LVFLQFYYFRSFCFFFRSNTFAKFRNFKNNCGYNYNHFFTSINRCNKYSLSKFEKRFDARKSRNILFPYIIGLAFGFGWTPCIGPILGSILALASIEETLSRAILLLSFYSLGLAIPFVLSGYLIQKFLLFSKNFKKNINIISKIGGVILLITGILILTNQLQAIGFYIIKIFPFMQNFG